MKLSQITKYRSNETIQNFLWRSIQIAAKHGTTFLIFFISAYYLPPEKLGLFSYLMAIIGLLIIVCDFGFSTSTSKFVAELKAKKSKKLNTVLYSISIIIFSIASIVSLFIFIFGKSIFKEYSLLLYLIPYLFFLPLSSVADGVYRGLKEFKKLSIINIFVAVISLPIGFILIKNYGLIGTILSQNLFFGLLMLGLFVFRKDTTKSLNKIVTKKIIKYALIIGLANIAYYLYTRVDILILKQFGFVAEIGYYEVINKIFRVIILPAVIFGQAIAPNTTKYITLKKDKKVKSIILKYLPYFIISGILLSLVINFTFPLVIKSFFTKYYTKAFSSILTILLFLLPFKLWGVFLVNGFITPGGFARIITISTFIGGFLNIIFDLIFINWLGFIGVFWVTLFIHSLSIIAVSVLFFRNL